MDTSTPTGSAGPDPAPGAPAPEPAAPPQAATTSNSFFAGVRRLGVTRSDDRWIGGVGAGVADRFGLDPLLVRGLFFATLLLGGIGLVVYGVAWALLPERRDGRIHLEEMILGRFDIALLGALAFVLVGLGRGDGWFFFWGPPGWLQGLLWLAFLVGVVVLVVAVANQQPSRPRPPAGYAPQAPYGSYAAPAGSAPVPPAADAPAPATWVPPRPVPAPRPPKPPRVRTPGAGAGTVGVVVALGLLSLAVLLVAERSGDFTGPVALTALGIGIVLCGVGIIVSGLRGRTSGGLGGLAVLGILVAVPLGAVQNATWSWTDGGRHDLAASGEVVLTDRTEAAQGLSLGFGTVTIDLTDVPMTSQTLDVPISLAAGDLTVVVPSGTSVTADVEAGAGTVRWDVDGTTKSVDGVGLDPRTFSTADVGSDGPQLALQVQIGAGDVSITEEN